MKRRRVVGPAPLIRRLGKGASVRAKRIYGTLEVRFRPKVDERGADECWPWLAMRNSRGYGLIRNDEGKNELAHRVAWRLVESILPSRLCILHSCDNPPCCNPAHLFIGTRADNIADMCAKGRDRHPAGLQHWSHTYPERRPRGEGAGQAKLTDAAVRQIRKRVAQGESYRALGREYGVAKGTIKSAAIGETWAHICF